MPHTPLELELMQRHPNGGIPLSDTIAIIGTDKPAQGGHPVRGGDLLKTLYVYLKNSAQDIHSNCLSAV